MGMSSSQARLLTLTSRLHSIEHKAQKLEAEKLRLANDSDRVYENYLRALDATKIQYSCLQQDGTIAFKDATLANLENGAVPSYTGETSKNTYLLYDGANNKVLVTPEFAAEYGITGSDIGDIGTLDDWLTAHGCTKEDVMKTVWETDYSDVKSVTPVANQLIQTTSTSTVTDPNTYSISGTLSTPVDSSTSAITSYSESGATPTVSAVAGTSSPITKTVVTSGTDATSSVANITTNSTTAVNKTTYTINAGQTYNAFEGVTYQLKTEDLNLTMQQLSDKYSWNFDFTDTICSDQPVNTANTLITYYDNQAISTTYFIGGYKNSKQTQYTASTKLSDLLTTVASLSSNINFNASTGVLSSSEILYFLSTDDYGNHQVLAKYLTGIDGNSTRTLQFSSTTQPFSLDSKIKDVTYSDKGIYAYSSLSMTGENSMYLRIKDKDGNDINTYWNGTSVENITYRDYFEYLKTDKLSAYNFNYTENSDGSISITMDGDYTFNGIKNITSTTTKTGTTTNDTDIKINRNAIAENIYLARSIINETKSSDYTANHDSQITSILTEMKTAYSNYATDENKRQLLLFSEQLSTALASGNKTQIQDALNQIGNTITSDKYKSGTTTDANGNQTINNVTYSFNDSAVSITPSTTDIPDGTTSTPGTLTVASNSDMEKYLAYQLYQYDDSQTYENYLSNIQAQGYDAYQLAELVENFSSYKTQLATGTNLSASLTKYNSASYTLNQSSSNNYNVTNTSSAATYDVTVANADDILDRLAYDVYVEQGKTGDPNSIKTQLSSIFNNSQLASLSFYYGQPAWNTIVTNLASSMSASAVSTYTNKYAGYNITYKTSDDVTITTTPNSHPVTNRGKVNTPSINGIASNLTVAFRKAGYTVDEADIRAKLEANYNADTNSNNLILANINEVVCDYLINNAGSVANIYNHLYSGSALSITNKYDSNYDVTRVDMGVARVEYGQTSNLVPTGEKKWVEDENYKTWYKKYMELSALKEYKFEIVRADLCVQNQFVNNYITEAGAHLLVFGLTEDGNFDLKETNVSVETSLIEVQNELNLKKAEAQYEADMKKIDRKDAQYDTQIAKCENERSAIKEEIETLKTVAKENVDRTFKLFA